jgi:predicted Zn-dependent protease
MNNEKILARRRALIGIGGCGLGLCSLVGCHSTPVTGRRRLLLTPENQEIQLGLQAYQETLSSEQLSSNQRLAELVKRVGNRIANVSNRNDYKWEFNLIANSTQNAFALPGGKVAIYEGILPICQHEAGLAVVMAHEVAHALARHGGERMTQQTAVNVGKQVASKITNQRFPGKAEMVAQYYGAATQYGILLPFSRKHEAEADHIGIILMARAGYDPASAPEFWRRFGNVKQGEQTPEWLSTHPADDRRAANLMNLMDEATTEYKRAPQRFGMGESLV